MHSAMVERISSTHQRSIKTINLSYKPSPSKTEQLLNWDGWRGTASNKTRYVLKNVNCEAKPGELTAIAGSSGAGKTTLLEILAGVIVPSRVIGHVLVNDRPLNVAHFLRVSCYVTQDEALFPLLTVQETIMYSARLRLRGGHEAARERVRNLLKELGLDHVAGLRIGSQSTRGISGGEKRRVSIGVDLVHDPAVLLMDEPTSGLDSASALQVLMLLKSIAKNQGKTILISIHQPGFRILDLFDRVILLSGGIVLHDGPLDCLEERLTSTGYCIPHHVNVLEYAIDVSESLSMEKSDVEKGEAEQDITDHVIITSVSSNIQKRHISYSNSSFVEILILAQRFSTNIFRSKDLFCARTIQALVAGILLGTIFMDTYNSSKRSNIQTQIGFMGFILTFLLSSTTEALPIFLQERIILMRETSRGSYRISSYVIANTLVFVAFLLQLSLLFTTPLYWLVGLRREIDGFLYFSLVAWMVLLMANSFAAFFSALVPNFISGMSLIAGIMGAFFLFSGYFISNKEMPKYWLFMHYLSLMKYPLECLLLNEFGGEKGRGKCVEGVEEGCLMYGDAFLRNLGIEESQKWSNLVVMLAFIVGYRVLCYLALWYRSYRSRS